MTAMIAPSLALMLSLNAQQTAPALPGSTQDRQAHEIDCRAEYEQATKSLKEMLGRLDAADRSHEEQAIRSAVSDARRLVASVKAKVTACTPDTDGTVSVDPVCLRDVDPKTAPAATYRGKRYVFCSNADKAKFERDPKRYMHERGR